MKRGLVQKVNSKMFTIWVPRVWVPEIDRGVRKLDLDRSKFVRTSIREKLARHGIAMRTEEAGQSKEAA